MSRPAPQRCSAKAAAFTSVSKPTGHENSCPSIPTTSTSLQPALGVLPMKPYFADCRSRMTGPKEATPIALKAPWEPLCSTKKSRTAASVEMGSLVGKRNSAWSRPLSSPMAHTNFVPPASTARNAIDSRVTGANAERIRGRYAAGPTATGRAAVMNVPSAASRAMIERLIAFNTVSRDSNLGLIEWVRDYLQGFGAKTRLTHDATGKKANLFATLGDSKKPGLILSGHTDVVPVDGQAWETDPFVATERNGKLYARGSADMKGFIGIALAQAPQFVAALNDNRLDVPLHYSLSYDEEIGCVGVRGLIRDLEENAIRPAGCVVGEPTSMQPIIAHKGTHRFRCSVHGREAHSSYVTHGVNAIEYAARLVVFIRQ